VLRGISCGISDLLVAYRWYPLDGSLASHFRWYGVVAAIFLGLLLVSFRVIPGKLALVPQDEPIRLDLS
jgi:hypothetical protein